MADISKTYKQRQLKSKEDTFDITQTLYQQVNNDYWREKSNLWTIISAACNDAAGEFYVKLKEYVKNLADIDVCTIHNLKSIAQSVDAKHLLDFTYNLQTFPVELRELLDILSIKPSKLLETDQKLHESSILSLLGNIDMRSTLVRPEEIPLTLLIDIFDNIDKIEKWFEYNSIFKDFTIKYIFDDCKADGFSETFLSQAKLYNDKLEDDSLIWYYGLDNRTGENDVTFTKLPNVLFLKVDDIFNNIKQLQILIGQNEEDISKGTQLAQLLSFEFKYDKESKTQKEYIVNTFNTNSLVVYKNGKYVLNPFFALIEIVKARLFASQNSVPLVPFYKEIGDNEVTINMTDLCQNMVQTIKKNDACYIRNFMFFHIYTLISSKILNDKLKDDFNIEVKTRNLTTDTIRTTEASKITNWNDEEFINVDKITYNSKYSQMTYDQFYPNVSGWISNNELKEFLGQKIDQDVLNITKFEQIEITNKVAISHYKKEYIDFIQYLSLVKAITRQIENEQRTLPFLIYRYNNYIDNITVPFNQYKRNLLGITEDRTTDGQNQIQKVAEYLTDICIKISYIRQEIKALVQQYSFIGTQRIVTDVVRDYFVKNFSKRSSWRYISDLFKNKDNTPYLRTLNDLNGEKQFTANLVQYFDQTAYLNIQTDLPEVINGYNDVLTTFPSTYVVTEDTVSTWLLPEDRVSTIYDRFNFEIPSSLYPSPSMVSTLTIPAVTSEGTSLYAETVTYNSSTTNLVTNSNIAKEETTVVTSEPVSTQFTNYIQTIPTSSIFGEDQVQDIFSSYCTQTLKLTNEQYQQLRAAVVKLIYNRQTIDEITYYSVIAEIPNTTMNSVIIAETTNTVNIPGGNSPVIDSVISVTKYPAPTKVVLQEQQQLTGDFYNPAASSFIIPAGTPVSTVIAAGTEITVDVTSTLHLPIWVDGNELVQNSNARFWEKNIDYLNWEDLEKEISFYQKYFPQLANAPTEKAKIQVYKDEVYPLLTEIWDKNATSGMLDGQNDRIHQQYSGKYPGKQLERNIGNQDFTTIAPLPYIPNLIPVDEYQNDDSYIVKPLYDNISYYMNMFMAQMFNMYKIRANDGLAIAIDGWKQTHIQMKGYCSKYQRSANTITTEGQMNSKLDFDGPWVYSSLQTFLTLDGSQEEIDYFVNNYFFNLNSNSIDNIKGKLFRYQNDIRQIGKDWKLYSFESDLNDNQYTLFKRKDFYKYEDVGRIWVRMKNFPVSMPLMNNNVVIDFKDVKYQNDMYDTLLFNEDGRYANMLKQMTNNAVQFGVVKNVMWILGWTNYSMNVSQRLIYNPAEKMLRLVSFTFKPREDFTLLVTDVHSYSLIEQSDKLNNFNQFVGVNYRQKDDTIDFILFDKDQKRFVIQNLVLADDKVISNEIPFRGEEPALQIEQIEALTNVLSSIKTLQNNNFYHFNFNNQDYVGKIYQQTNNYYYISGDNFKFLIFNEDLESLQLSQVPIFSGQVNPFFITHSLNDVELSFIVHNYTYKKDTVEFEPTNETLQLGQSYLINNISPNISVGTIYYDGSNYRISGYSGKKQDKNYTIYQQMLTGTQFFDYALNCDDLSVISTFMVSSFIVELPDIDVKFIPLVNYNMDIDKQLFDVNSVISSYANIWRVGADQNSTGIAYQTYDFDGKGDISSLFVVRQENVQNQKTIKNVLSANCELLTKQVIDSSNNVIYLNQIKSISTSIETATLYLEDTNVNDYIAIQQLFPYCQLTKDNHLMLSSLVTTLGAYKSLTVDKEQKNIQQENGMRLLTSTIDPLVVCDNSFEDVITDKDSYFYRNKQRIQLDDNLEPYKRLFGDITGSYNFYEYYDQYLEAKENGQPLSEQKKYLQMYNQQMVKLNDIVAFAPVINEYIIEPLKIVFNFGNMFDFDINEVNSNGKNYFDMDINTYIDTFEQKYKKVGWKAGLWQTDYLNWITRDQRFGSPEIVIVDIEKYKNDNMNKYEMSLPDHSIDIIVNACWFAQSQIQSLNPNIFINWKGFTYQYMVEDIDTNSDLCNNPFIKIRVGLNNNTLRCYRKVLLPVCLTNKHTDEKLFGFIREWEDQIIDDQYIRATYQTDVYEVNIALTDETTFKNYQQFEAACDDEEQAIHMLSLVGIHDTTYAKKLKDSLNWNKTMILKVNDDKQLEIHIKKIII